VIIAGMNTVVCHANAESILDTMPFPLEVADQDVSQLMREFSRRTSVMVSLNDAIRGKVTVRNSAGTVGSFLDQVAERTASVWWYDGVVVTLESRDTIQSTLVDIDGYPIDRLNGQLSEMGLAWDAFPVRATSDGVLARVAGPTAYVGQVTDVIERLVANRRERGEGGVKASKPNIFHGGRSIEIAPAEQ